MLFYKAMNIEHKTSVKHRMIGIDEKMEKMF